MDTELREQFSLDAEQPPVPLGIARVSLVVRDLGRVTDFYRDVIGLAVIRTEPGQVHLGVGGITLVELVHRPMALPDDPAGAGLFHTAFLLPTRVDLGRWLVHARSIGPILSGAADHLVSEAVYLNDPEGNGIEVYADRPAAVWNWTGTADAPRVEMANRPLDVPGLIAAADTPWRGAPVGTRIGHVHLRVGDVTQAVTFFCGVLGLDVTRMFPEAAFLSTGGYHHHIAANVWRSLGAGRRDPAMAGLASVTMEAADASVIAAIAGRSQTEDLATTGVRDPWGTQIKIILAHR